MKKLLIQAWGLERDSDGYHISSTHYGYLTEIVKYYDRVCLLSPVKKLGEGEKSKRHCETGAGVHTSRKNGKHSNPP